jgi:multiple sugar transport system permease protein
MTATRWRRTRIPLAFLTPFAVAFLAFFIVPIGYAVYGSLFRVARSGPLGLGPTTEVFAGLENYGRALGSDGFVGSLGRVLLFAAIQVPVMIVLAVGLALLLDSRSAAGVRFFRTVYFLPHGVPGVIASILWGFLYVPGLSPIVDLLTKLGLDVDFLGGDTVLFSIANIVTWQLAGFTMFVIIAQLAAIPTDLYEAARIDGARAWQVIWHIKLPLIRPAILLTTVFTLIWTVQLFAEPLILQSRSTSITSDYTPNMSAYNAAFHNNDYHLAAAEAVLLAAGIAVLAFGVLRLVGRKDAQ